MNEFLLEKWEPILASNGIKKIDEITDYYRRNVTAQLLENQEHFLKETSATTVTANVDKWDPVLISLVRRMAPKLIAFDVCGVQPMTMPTGLVFAMRSRYTDKNGTEALYNEANSSFSGTGTHEGTDPFAPIGTVIGTTITAPGANYTSAPTISFSGGGGSGAAATAILGTGANEGKVVNIIIANPGTSYTSAPTISFSGGGGSGAAATATINLGFSNGTGMPTADGETNNWNSMSMTIEKTSVTAKTRMLRADYSPELAQDLNAIHGLNADNELVNILSSEIIAEINREVVRTIYGISKIGAQFASEPGTFDLKEDADGRWSVERFKGLIFAIERDANAVALDTKRGKANIIITRADVASALVMAGVLDHNPIPLQVGLDVDPTGTHYAGTMGRFKVFVDPYLSTDGYVVGYKGNNAYDAGFFYCPYVPLQMVRATNVDNFQPAIGFKTRYGLVSNPFTTL